MKSRFLFLFFFLISFCVLAQEHASHLKFIKNKGQWEERVKYRADLPGGKLFAEKNSFTYVFYDAGFFHNHHDHQNPSAQQHNIKRSPTAESVNLKFHSFRVKPLEAEENPVIISSKESSESYNYYIGKDPSKWASKVKASGELMYKDIYNKIDLRLYESENSFKYEFIVSPEADPNIIQLKYEGLKDIFIRDGNLVIMTSVNSITEEAPYVYQNINGEKIKIRSSFHLKDSVVKFELHDSYNRDQPLIIDPKLIFSTYSGSYADNWGNTAAYDDAGDMYSGGTVFNVGYPATIGAFQVNYAGYRGTAPLFDDEGFGVDVGILKFNPTGTNLLYATYLGGYATEAPYSLVVNSSDELVIMGTTSSFDFPTTPGAFDNTFNGGDSTEPDAGMFYLNGSDIFISRLSADGSMLLASTYIGGSENDGIQLTYDTLTANYGDQLRGDVITDDQNNIYVACNTLSDDFPVTPGCFQSTKKGSKEGCVFKFNTTMTSLLWSSYIGGTEEDAAYSIQVDNTYNVYISGGTASNDFPVTSGVYQSIQVGKVDGFVSHISNDGQTILHSSYVGTTEYDQAYFVQLDDQQNVYLFGQTKGAYPVSNGVYSNAKGGQFIHGFTPDLNSTIFSTVIGSGGYQPNISPTAFLVNDCGNIFLSGWGGYLNHPFFGYIGGTTFNMPVTSDAYRSTSDGSDFYIMVLSKNAQNFLYGTYFGMNNPATPDHVDGGTSRFDKKGMIYEAVCGGCGNNDNFPTTPGAWSRTNNSSNCNNVAFKFDLVYLEARFVANKNDSCAKTSVDVVNTSISGRTYLWDFGDGTTSTAKSPSTHIYTNSGTYKIRLIVTDLTTCIGSDTAETIIFIPPKPPISFNLIDTTICSGNSVQLGTTSDPTYTYSWTPALYLNSTNIANPVSTPSQNMIYHVVVQDTNQCKVQRNVTVNIYSPPLEAGVDQMICPNSSTSLNVVGNGTFEWEISPYLSCSLCQSPKLTLPAVSDDYYTVKITDSIGCTNYDSVRVYTRPLPDIHVSFDWNGRCYKDNFDFYSKISFSDNTCPVAGKPTWDFGDGKSSNEYNPSHLYTAQGNYSVTLHYAYSNIAKDTVIVFSNDSCLKNVFIPNTFTPNGDGNNDLVFLRTINAKKVLLRIFNRWDEEVFRTESLHEGWDGTYKGVKQTPQTFVYTADVTFWDDSQKVIEGNITLVE